MTTRRAVLTLLTSGLFAPALWAAESIRLGASAALSGPAASLGLRYHAGAHAALLAVNQLGGVRGARVAMDLHDDRYEPDRALHNTEALVADPRVLALLGYVGTPTSMAALPLVKRHNLAFVGPFTGADALWEHNTPQVFNVRASYRDEARALAQAVKADGARSLNVLYQADLFGRAGLEAMKEAAAKAGLNLVAVATVKRNTTEVAEAVSSLVTRRRADAIFMVSTYQSCAAFMMEARAAGYGGRFYTLSFAGLEPLRKALGGSLKGLTIAQVVPDPEDAALPVVADYQAAMRASGEAEMDSISLEGYLSALVMLEALRRAERPLSRAGVLKALAALGRLDLGGFVVQYSASERRGAKLVRLVKG